MFMDLIINKPTHSFSLERLLCTPQNASTDLKIQHEYLIRCEGRCHLLLLCSFGLLAYFSLQNRRLVSKHHSSFSHWVRNKSFPAPVVACLAAVAVLIFLLFSWHLSVPPQAVQQSFANCVWTMRLWLLMEFRWHIWATHSGRIKWHLPCKPAAWPWIFAAMATRVR